MTEYIRRHGRVLECVIATKANGATLDMAGTRQAAAAIASLATDALAGCVLLTSDGPNFCTGGDVRAFAAAEDRGAYVGHMAEEFHALIHAIADAQVPVVAAVHGWAAGAGMSIVCASDVTVGGPSTRLRPAYPSIGFSPDGGMSPAPGQMRPVSVARAAHGVPRLCPPKSKLIMRYKRSPGKAPRC
ncbi:MAG TPA: enoyl-CoA hydratase/isomerase family protein [Trebonia sp.]|jgi:2-(1,2-epoxy-1,2-dihydrophenyl)acetyl-CoA isomerase|nr:enoyl-CoA hydratase/isomerase family protein [Trebonia sp.]